MTYEELQEIREKWEILLKGKAFPMPEEWVLFFRCEMPRLFIEINRLKNEVQNLTLDMQIYRKRNLRLVPPSPDE